MNLISRWLFLQWKRPSEIENLSLFGKIESNDGFGLDNIELKLIMCLRSREQKNYCFRPTWGSIILNIVVAYKLVLNQVFVGHR